MENIRIVRCDSWNNDEIQSQLISPCHDTNGSGIRKEGRANLREKRGNVDTDFRGT